MPKVASPPLPEGVTAGQMARAAGVTERVILGRKADGRLPVRPDGSIDLYPIIRAGIAALASEAKGEAGAGGLDQARIEVLNEQRDRLRMLNEQMRGDTVLAEDMENVVGAYADAVRAKVLGLPTRAAPLVLGVPSLAEVRDKLTELAHEACGDLAATEIVSAVHDRARRRAGRSEGGNADIPSDGAAAEADG